MPGTGEERLKKRQTKTYKKYVKHFASTNMDEEYDAYEKAVHRSLQKLVREIDQRSPYDAKGRLKNGADRDAKMSIDDMKKMAGFYKAVLSNLNALIDEVYERMEDIREDAYTNLTLHYEMELMQNEMGIYDGLAKSLSKDLAAFEKSVKNGQEMSLRDIYEESRVNASYQVTFLPGKNKGGQNERIPVEVTKEDVKEQGYFTPDKPVRNRSITGMVANSIKKFGSAADFLSVNKFMSVFNDINGNDPKMFSHLANQLEVFTMQDYNKILDMLDANTATNMRTFLNTPEKLNVFLIIAGEAFSERNKQNILGSVGIKADSRMNRRNAAMSKVAEFLGVPDLLAHSENIRFQSGNRTYKGTYMKNAIGHDHRKMTKDSPFLKANKGSLDNLDLKKMVANLQILDYLCGNPDRHGGNMLYDFRTNPDGTVTMVGIQGIDNDSCFGSQLLEMVGLSEVKLENMRVITREMANKILTLDLDSLKQMLYGFELSAEELSNMGDRLKALQNKIKNDNAFYSKGYSKGVVAHGKIKIVDDDELAELDMERELASTTMKEKHLRNTLLKKAGKTPEQIQIDKQKYDQEMEKLKKENNLFDAVLRRSNGFENINSFGVKLYGDYADTAFKITVGAGKDISGLVEDMKRDHKNLFGGGSSGAYNTMLSSMKALQKALIGFTGPIYGKDKNGNIVDTDHGHCANLQEVKEKLRTALTDVNQYILYKQSKPDEKESWRNAREGHKPGRTERRYKDALKARKFLNEQLDMFEQLDAKLEDIHWFENNKQTLWNDCKKNLEDYEKSDKVKNYYTEKDKVYRGNHITRSVYTLEQEHKMAGEHFKDGELKAANLLKLEFEMQYGFTLNSLKEEDRETFKNMVFEKTGEKFDRDAETLMEKAVATTLVYQKMLLNDKTRRNQDEREILSNLCHIKLDSKADNVERLMQSQEFKTFYQATKQDWEACLDAKSNCVTEPDTQLLKNMCDKFCKHYETIHPEARTQRIARQNSIANGGSKMKREDLRTNGEIARQRGKN